MATSHRTETPTILINNQNVRTLSPTNPIGANAVFSQGYGGNRNLLTVPGQSATTVVQGRQSIIGQGNTIQQVTVPQSTRTVLLSPTAVQGQTIQGQTVQSQTVQQTSQQVLVPPTRNTVISSQTIQASQVLAPATTQVITQQGLQQSTQVRRTQIVKTSSPKQTIVKEVEKVIEKPVYYEKIIEKNNEVDVSSYLAQIEILEKDNQYLHNLLKQHRENELELSRQLEELRAKYQQLLNNQQVKVVEKIVHQTVEVDKIVPIDKESVKEYHYDHLQEIEQLRLKYDNLEEKYINLGADYALLQQEFVNRFGHQSSKAPHQNQHSHQVTVTTHNYNITHSPESHFHQSSQQQQSVVKQSRTYEQTQQHYHHQQEQQPVLASQSHTHTQQQQQSATTHQHTSHAVSTQSIVQQPQQQQQQQQQQIKQQQVQQQHQVVHQSVSQHSQQQQQIARNNLNQFVQSSAQQQQQPQFVSQQYTSSIQQQNPYSQSAGIVQGLIGGPQQLNQQSLQSVRQVPQQQQVAQGPPFQKQQYIR